MDLSRRQFLLAGASLPLLQSSESMADNSAERVNRYNVVWNTPSHDASGVMPIGNGDIAAGVYAITDGDLYLLLSKNDAYTYMGDLFKTGRVRISLTPNPFQSGNVFRQTLNLSSGSIQIEAGGVRLSIWADAHRPVYHIEVRSPHSIQVAATPEFWKRFDHCVANETQYYQESSLLLPDGQPTQDVRREIDGRLLWYFAVGDRSVYQDDLHYYHVEHVAAQFADPYRFNTFGNLLDSPDLNLKDGSLRGEGQRFDIRIHALAMQTREPQTWIETIVRQAGKRREISADWKRHCDWWTRFWDRGWIIASDRAVPVEARERLQGETSADGRRLEEDGGALVSQSYQLFRFMMACQSRGRVQTKFNGGLFTQQLLVPPAGKLKRAGDQQVLKNGLLLHEDDRLWGRRFTFQNQRLLYWPLLESGDFDLMMPFFNYYSSLLPVREAVTKAWFGHEGAYYRENIEPTGAERDCGLDGRPDKGQPGKAAKFYHSYHFISGLEITAMMIEYANYTGDDAFRDRLLVPFARQILLFYDRHYQRDAGGKIRLDPAQVLETWWQAVNPAPDIAGLRFCLDGLLALKAGAPEDQDRWRSFRTEIPEVPMQFFEGYKAIAPAEKWGLQKNCENGELYPVFPFRCFGAALGSADLVQSTMEHRYFKDYFDCGCWTQDQIHWAFAGNAQEAAKGLVTRARKASKLCRFPMYGDESPDSCPDFDQLGAGSVALQRMIVQEEAGKIVLLPAWPANWDADFKLHLARGAVLTGVVKNGKLAAWDVQPESRRKEVVVYPDLEAQ